MVPDDKLLEETLQFARNITKKNSNATWQNKQGLLPFVIDEEQSAKLQHQFYDSVNREESVERILRYTAVTKKKFERECDETSVS